MTYPYIDIDIDIDIAHGALYLKSRTIFKSFVHDLPCYALLTMDLNSKISFNDNKHLPLSLCSGS